jgi:hypothetical protein
MIDRLVDLVFSEWKDVKIFLETQQVTIEDQGTTYVCFNSNHNITVGFNWETLDIYTRGHQLQFILFGGRHFIELNTAISNRYQQLKKRGN